ncbi:MAG: SAM-dependent chlorinase/fluorinase [Acidobacteriaceae bacterium]|nr:SAM-dependent chlorinase/fluorinase [Acidobacteriaceae bacterium]
MSSSFSRPVITLTTDFGTSDHYVGTMKGVLLTRCPNATLVDISHEIPPFSIEAGAYAIEQAASYFPPGTVHVVVIDPGVGTSRRAIIAQVSGHTFVAPDNGVLSLVLSREPKAVIREVVNKSLWPNQPSSTFHGRDIFAPVAGALAAGTARPEDVGPVCGWVEMLPNLLPAELAPGVWSGKVLSVDRFGNVITNFESGPLAAAGFQVASGRHVVTEFHTTFGQAPPGVCFAYFGSSGYVELGMNQGSAAEHLQLRAGRPLTLRRVVE